MIRFREDLTARYQRDFMNHNDTKIVQGLLRHGTTTAGVACYLRSRGRKPRQTRRYASRAQDAILPWINSNPSFQQVLGGSQHDP